jgi:hypothetical protein
VRGVVWCGVGVGVGGGVGVCVCVCVCLQHKSCATSINSFDNARASRHWTSQVQRLSCH